MLRLAFVTGTEPGKWFARYRETTGHGLEEIPSDDPFAMLIDGSAELALVRLPDPRVGEPGEQFHQVRLYAEKPGVAVPKDSVYAEVGEAVQLADLADEHVNYRFVPGAGAGAGVAAVAGREEGFGAATGAGAGSGTVSTADVSDWSDVPSGSSIDDLRAALQVVAANVGIAFAPAPLLKVLSKKQVVVLHLRGADGSTEARGNAEGDSAVSANAAGSEIGLVWKVEDDSETIQDFVGVAKGRTRNSSRGGGDASKSVRSRTKVKRKVNGKTSGQRKGIAKNSPKKGVKKRRR